MINIVSFWLVTAIIELILLCGAAALGYQIAAGVRARDLAQVLPYSFVLALLTLANALIVLNVLYPMYQEAYGV